VLFRHSKPSLQKFYPFVNMKYLYLLFLVISISNNFISQTLHIHITDIRNTAGNIRLAFYTNSKAFDEEKALFIRTVPKKNLRNKSLTISYSDLLPANYGIAILDDENANEKMDYGWVLPVEGFGFSDYYHQGMTRPKFEAFDFELKKEDKTVEIKVRYL